ncbi:YciI family protein [Aurantiacibacter gangjinensis]|uniref:Uncharacterized protein n=1 Tax=Aurantiacibacter gangjinensis TaxID=502682 RepID=A0A0G9MMW4_9SPHN|nr:YciI family protein [Aurantiacibacter gangjinensis]APE28125.1 hypothetical protein BMF35_a1296 [Aurantiacibacter gangjinensis]KLE32045.1 hypothetical protein AAW01_11510 [Aurantiacibacter gangjinensis]
MNTLYACWCRDGADAARLRDEHLAAHLAHIEANLDRYAVAGPLKDEGGTNGSLLIVKATSREDARAFLEADPYFHAGIWPTIAIEPFCAVAGDWVGGAAWKGARSG